MLARATDAVEVLDRPVAPADRDASLADIERLSAWFGGYALSRRAIEAMLPPGEGRTWRVLDVGGGRGGFARRLVDRARRRRQPVRVFLVDRDPAMLAAARRDLAAYPEIVPVCADATALPFVHSAVDVATSSLTLHHLPPAGVVAALAEMAAASRTHIVVNDLLRTRLTLFLVSIATRIVARHPISRHDGPLSVRRAYSPAELRILALQAGIARFRIRRHRLLGRLIGVAS
jgi:ubiquinone/menaquinone biosynthesis C-methylase UbiE